MPTILVVEGEAEVREMIVEIVRCLNYAVLPAASGADAVATFQRERPDAVLLNMVLPDAGGTEMLERLHELRPDVPIIMVSANAEEELARETLRRGAFDYIAKPFEVEQLTLVLEAALAS